VDQRDPAPDKSLDVWSIPSPDATGKIIALSVVLRKSIAVMNKVQGRIACRNAYW
jgi:aspartate carbamoyltransferase regulatory subunit